MSLQLFTASVLTGIKEAYKPLIDALDSPEAFASFLAGYGYGSLVTDLQQIDTKFSSVKGAFDGVEKAAEKVNDLRGKDDSNLVKIAEAVQELSAKLIELTRAIDDLKEISDYVALPAPLDQEQFWKDFPTELVGSLLHRYLEAYKPRLFSTLTAFGILSAEFIDEQILAGTSRSPYTRRQVNWKLIERIVSHPDRFMKEVYGFGNMFAHERLVSSLAILAGTLGLPAAPADLSEEVLTRYYANDPSAREIVRQFVLPLYFDVFEAGGAFGFASLDIVLAPVPPVGNPAGNPEGFVFFPVLWGNVGKEIRIGESAKAFLEGGFEAINPPRLEIRPGGIQVVVTPELGVAIGASAELAIAPEKALILLGVEESSRFEIGRIGIELSARGPVIDLEYRVRFAAENTTLLLYLTEGDSFLQKSMPKEGLKVQLDFQLGWSSKSGFFFGGSAGLEATLPVHVDLLGVVKVDSVYLSLLAGSPAQAAAIEAVVAATAKIKLGPFTANVERMGLRALLTFPEKGGNLGVANLELDFKPPNGAGLVIDSAAIVGGGYLWFDPKNEQYAGVLQLEIKGTVILKAIGLLTTRLPGLPPGQKGFSLLVIISAEFPPIQLGFGFTLTGVGGLLGANRTMLVDVLRAGIKNRTLDSILFPKNPVANAPKIISDLQRVFPPIEGRFVFGPMAKLGWGGALPILTVELGVLLELPSPVRLALLGKLTLALPKEELAVVIMRMDIIGAIEFDKGDASIDATLYDSRLAQYVVSGDMALRLNWGATPTFAMAAGGFHPKFSPPPGFPSPMKRLAISLATGDNPQLKLDAYLAVTANTIQFGARLNIYAFVDVPVLGKFSASANLGFDALVQLDPFLFVAEMDGSADIKQNGKTILAASLYVNLSGPTPWHAWGEATFKFLGKRRIGFDITWSRQKPSPPLPPVNPFIKLQEALADHRNWNAQLPGDGHVLVSLRQIQVTDEVLVHPLGVLTVRQKVVPLDTAIAKFGTTRPTSPGPFTIEQIRIGPQPSYKGQVVREMFAPGQFFEFSGQEKLTRPAFESLPAGLTGIGTAAISYSPVQVRADLKYDTVVIDNLEERASRKDDPDAQDKYKVPLNVFLTTANWGAAGQSAMRSTGSATFAGPSDQKVTFGDPEYVIVRITDMAAEVDEKRQLISYATYTEAKAALLQKGASRDQYQIVGRHEVKNR